MKAFGSLLVFVFLLSLVVAESCMPWDGLCKNRNEVMNNIDKGLPTSGNTASTQSVKNLQAQIDNVKNVLANPVIRVIAGGNANDIYQFAKTLEKDVQSGKLTEAQVQARITALTERQKVAAQGIQKQGDNVQKGIEVGITASKEVGKAAATVACTAGSGGSAAAGCRYASNVAFDMLVDGMRAAIRKEPYNVGSSALTAGISNLAALATPTNLPVNLPGLAGPAARKLLFDVAGRKILEVVGTNIVETKAKEFVTNLYAKNKMQVNPAIVDLVGAIASTAAAKGFEKLSPELTKVSATEAAKWFNKVADKADAINAIYTGSQWIVANGPTALKQFHQTLVNKGVIAKVQNLSSKIKAITTNPKYSKLSTYTKYVGKYLKPKAAKMAKTVQKYAAKVNKTQLKKSLKNLVHKGGKWAKSILKKVAGKKMSKAIGKSVKGTAKKSLKKTISKSAAKTAISRSGIAKKSATKKTIAARTSSGGSRSSSTSSRKK